MHLNFVVLLIVKFYLQVFSHMTLRNASCIIHFCAFIVDINIEYKCAHGFLSIHLLSNK